jgi:regulatory protein
VARFIAAAFVFRDGVSLTGTITALKVQERAKDRVNVFLDGNFAFGLALIHAVWLKVGQTLTDADIATLKEADTLEKAKQKALGFIAYRPRSVQEVQRRLKRAGLDEEASATIVSDLRAAGLLDDESFSKAWVESRLGASPRSKRMIAWELRQKGVSEAAIAAATGEVDDDASAYQLALKRWPKVKGLQPAGERRRKLTEHLARYGFSFDTIRDTVERLEQEMGSDSGADEDAGDPATDDV